MRIKTSQPARTTSLLLAGLAASVWIRVIVGGWGAAQSPRAGLLFAGCLVALGVAVRTKVTFSRYALFAGVLGGLALCLPATLAHLFGKQSPVSFAGYSGWALVVATVAVSEEYFLRGAFYDSVAKWHGESAAVITGAVAFAGLHVPLYGWHIIPLDLAVGLWLGVLRMLSKTWTAPAIAHSLADLLAWWLR